MNDLDRLTEGSDCTSIAKVQFYSSLRIAIESPFSSEYYNGKGTTRGDRGN
jgi:hypothetical protein